MPGAGAALAPPCAPPDFSPRRPRLALPPLACDCHAHILGPAARHAYSPQRVYTPPDCLLPDYLAMLSALGVARAVLVQPSVYGTDNTVLLGALREGGERFRGVAVVGEAPAESELEAMHAAGVRGVRVNVVDVREGRGVLPHGALRELAARIAPLGWHLELLAHVDEFPALDRELADLPVDLVFGHLGYQKTALGLDHPGFRSLCRLAAAGRAWVKLTGPYRISSRPMPHDDVTPFAHALLELAPDRVVWGSDWPHVMVKGPMPNDGDLADLLASWVPDERLRRRVLVENPARLYGFG